MNIIIFLIVGALAGWLAGVIMRGGGFGILGNIIVGIIGSFIAGFLIPLVFKGTLTSNPTVDAFIYALVGAIILLFVIGLFRKAK